MDFEILERVDGGLSLVAWSVVKDNNSAIPPRGNMLVEVFDKF